MGHVLDLAAQSLCSSVVWIERERVLRLHLHGTAVLSHFFAQDFCAHSGIMTDHAVSTFRISFKTDLKPDNIVSRFLQRAEPNIGIFEDV